MPIPQVSQPASRLIIGQRFSPVQSAGLLMMPGPIKRRQAYKSAAAWGPADRLEWPRGFRSTGFSSMIDGQPGATAGHGENLDPAVASPEQIQIAIRLHGLASQLTPPTRPASHDFARSLAVKEVKATLVARRACLPTMSSVTKINSILQTSGPR